MEKCDKGPALRISHIVYGRTSANHRVKYLVDSKGTGQERRIPEQVVLRRWRRRRLSGYAFSGARLSSTLWRAIPAMLGRDPAKWMRLDVGTLRRFRKAKSRKLRGNHLTPPSAETLLALFRICGARGLAALVKRHSDPGRRGRSGVPDLILYARKPSGSLHKAVFVEVKKPGERVSHDQCDEIAFLKQLRLRARVLRLIER